MSFYSEKFADVKFLLKTSWARFGFLSEFIAKKLSYKGPPILLISMPRSGSSWAARVIAQSSDLLYLDEPVTQSVLKYGITPAKFHLKKGCTPQREFKKIFDKCFLGVPSFDKKITKTSDWGLSIRSDKRLLIKEVTPLLCHYYIDHFNPQIIFLLRHPAGIVSSYMNLWASKSDQRIFLHDVSVMQASATKTAYQAIRNTNNHMVITYENLCIEPLKTFQSIFSFLNLTWTDEINDFLENTMNQNKSDSHHNIYRDSKKIAFSWKKKLSRQQIENIKSVYFKYDLPWYRDESQWQIE